MSYGPGSPIGDTSPHSKATGRGLILLAVVAVVGLYLLAKATPRISFNPVGSDWFGEGLVWLLTAALLGLLLIGPAQSRTTLQRRLTLLAIRIAVVVLVILMLLRPTLVYWAVHKRAATVAILVDTSASMKADHGDGQPRFARLKQMLDDNAKALADLAEDLEIKVYAFDSDIRELKFAGGTIELPESPEGEQSAHGYSLGEVLKREAGKRLAAVILASDGAQRALAPRNESPQEVARRLKGRNQPIYTVVFGPTDSLVQPRDVVLESLQADGSVHVKNRLAAKGEARLFGFPNETLPAELLWETAPGQMQVVERKPVRAAGGGEPTHFDIHYAPQSPGLYKMILRLAERPGELDTENNQQATIVRVTSGGLAVLYLEGGYHLETRSLLRSLGTAANIEVDLLRLDAQKPNERPQAVTETMSAGLQPGKYDVFVLRDLAAAAFLKTPDGKHELESLRERVREGAGLIMLGGVYSFGPGSYAQTPLNDVLPILMTPRDVQLFGDKLRTDKHILEKVFLRPSAKVANNPLTLLTTLDKNAQLWASLPPLANGANKLESREGTVLLEDGKGNPMLIAGTFGAGRVLAFAGDSTWRWTSHGFEDAHKRFWRQLILWLARKDQAEEGRVWVQAKERNVYVGQRVELSAGARAADGQPLGDFELQAELIRRDEKFQPSAPEKLAFNRQEDKRTLSLRVPQGGDYLLRVQAFQGGQLLGEAFERFLVREPKQLEMQRPLPDGIAMQQIAQLTGGQSVSPNDFSRVLDRLREIPKALQEEVRTVSSLWDPLRFRPLALLGLPITLAGLCGFAVALLLSVEWYLRKKWGLV
jgi:uncharacterized membrane protein